MKTYFVLFLLALASAGVASGQAPPVFVAPTPASPAPDPGTTAPSLESVTPAATPAPPPSAPAKLSEADLEKLVAPIALYPDPLIATLLPASVYPLEIVQAARFVTDTNNLANLDAQPWDENVKAIARVPEVIQKMNNEISWTVDLGEAFLQQDKDVMDAIQNMRAKAQKAGTLQTTPQQVVTVTNMIVEKTVEQQVVVVTNTVVEIQPASSSVVYVPTYNPTTVYYPPPAYVYNPIAPLVTFGAGMAMGAIIANNCDWHGGGSYHSDVNVDVNRNVNRNSNVNRNVNNNRSSSASGARASSTSGKKWQPDQSRLSKSGGPSASTSARSQEARGWGSGGTRPSTGNAAARPSTGAAGARPSAGNSGTRPSTGTPSANRPTASPSANRASPSPSASQARSSSSAGRSSSSGSAFSGVSSGSNARSSSSRGSASRGGGGRGGGGGSRGGGGGRR